MEVTLYQNYPNPFNPSTRISYFIPEDGFVSLKLYDLLGNEVMSIANEVIAGGYHDVDINLSRLASGSYFYKLSAGKYSSIKKLTLIK